jgi:hypothetical protein
MKHSVAVILENATTTVPLAGEALGLSRSAAYAAAGRGEIPTLKFGRRLVVPTNALRVLLGLAPASFEKVVDGSQP